MRQAGFTLIEMLVTMALLSLLAVLLFGGLRFGVRAWDGARAHGPGMEELRVAQQALRREIEMAYPRYDTGDALRPSVDFDGDETAMRFLAPPPQALDIRGRARIALIAAPDGKGEQLGMRIGDATSALLRHAAQIRFAYFDGGRWIGRWQGESKLPNAVRIRVSFKRGDGRVWPDLVVAPQIAMDSGCVYDASTQHCTGRP